MASFREAFLGKRFVCCALTIVYSVYDTVGRSIASIYDLGALRLGKYVASDRIYRLWTSLPYYIYNIQRVPVLLGFISLLPKKRLSMCFPNARSRTWLYYHAPQHLTNHNTCNQVVKCCLTLFTMVHNENRRPFQNSGTV